MLWSVTNKTNGIFVLLLPMSQGVKSRYPGRTSAALSDGFQPILSLCIIRSTRAGTARISSSELPCLFAYRFLVASHMPVPHPLSSLLCGLWKGTVRAEPESRECDPIHGWTELEVFEAP